MMVSQEDPGRAGRAVIPALEPVDEPGWIVKEPQEYFPGQGSTRYPDDDDR